MCHTKLGRKATRVFLRRLFHAGVSRSPYHFFTREQQRARFISRTTRSHNERFTAPVPRLEICFPANNCDVETYVITTPGLTSALALIKLSWPRTLFCEAITPFQTNAEAVTFLAHMFARIEGLTNTRATHRTPPISSSTPSPDPATFSTSLTPPSRMRRSPLHLHTTVVRTLANASPPL